MDDWFIVIDRETRKEADLYAIVLESYKKKGWARNLIYCDLEGWAIEQGGTLIIVDECGNYAYPSADRFWICLTLNNPTSGQER